MGICDNNENKNKPLGYIPLIGQSHEMVLTLKINDEDKYKKVDFISSVYKHFNSENVKIFINNNEVEFKKIFEPKNKGLYEIKIKIFVELLDCKNLFCDCKNIINIDLSNFRSDKVTSMESMFYQCSNLINIKFGSFNTKNVTTMERMFCLCFSLRMLDLSSFDTSNVINMSSMFNFNLNLMYINLSSLILKM